MNWQLPLLIAKDTTEQIKERVIATTLEGTTVPDSAVTRNIETSNPFATEYWFPEQASSFAGEVDYLFMAIFWISLAFFVVIVFFMVYYCIKYRRIDGKIDPLPSKSHDTTIEVLWSVLPSIFLVYMFIAGASTYMEMKTPAENAEEIKVIAYKYGWQFIYPNGDTTPELHLVMDQPVMLKMQSKDVLHSFFVAAFRQKQDIVPGRYTYAYIEPTLPGQYRLSCNEYCGDGHSKMRTMCEVHKTAEDRQANTEWIPTDHQAWENGQRLYQIHCAGCHSNKGVASTGPALDLTWGRKAEFADGSSLTVDENYIRESILKPSEKIVTGYGEAKSISKMNTFQGVLDETPGSDIDHIIAYLKYLQDPTSVAKEEAK